MVAPSKIEKKLLAEESRYCSYGDSVHYLKKVKLFSECDGSFLYDYRGVAYLDLQMWYSAVNLGYRNRPINNIIKDQIDHLPQLACMYLHKEKIQLSAAIARQMQKSFQLKGRVHFNVGGSQAIEDSIKLVRKITGKSLFFAFQGSYHGRTIAATEIRSFSFSLSVTFSTSGAHSLTTRTMKENSISYRLARATSSCSSRSKKARQ